MLAEMQKWLLSQADQLRTASPAGRLLLEQVVTSLGVVLVVSPGLRSSGLLTESDGVFTILVREQPRAGSLTQHQRFTIAHEIGHVLLIKKWDFRPPFSNRELYYQAEHLCNSFAGRLLVDPRLLIHQSLTSTFDAISAVCRLADICLVSREFVAREVVLLQPFLTFAQIAQGATEKEWLVEWCVRGDAPLRVARKKILRGESLDQAFMQWRQEVCPENTALLPSKVRLDRAAKRFLLATFQTKNPACMEPGRVEQD